jgi:hypothetical protein
MDKTDAGEVLAKYLATYRERSYEALRQLVDAPGATVEVIGPSGTRYQVEVQVFWDSARSANLRVRGAIDDCGWQAIIPQIEDFIVAPDGSFVGE